MTEACYLQPKVNKALKGYLVLYVLVIAEMGYLGYGPNAADLLFQVINGRYQKGSPILSLPTRLCDSGISSSTAPSIEGASSSVAPPTGCGGVW